MSHWHKCHTGTRMQAVWFVPSLPVLSPAAAMVMLHCLLPDLSPPETAGGTDSGNLTVALHSLAAHKHVLRTLPCPTPPSCDPALVPCPVHGCCWRWRLFRTCFAPCQQPRYCRTKVCVCSQHTATHHAPGASCRVQHSSTSLLKDDGSCSQHGHSNRA